MERTQLNTYKYKCVCVCLCVFVFTLGLLSWPQKGFHGQHFRRTTGHNEAAAVDGRESERKGGGGRKREGGGKVKSLQMPLIRSRQLGRAYTTYLLDKLSQRHALHHEPN